MTFETRDCTSVDYDCVSAFMYFEVVLGSLYVIRYIIRWLLQVALFVCKVH